MYIWIFIVPIAARLLERAEDAATVKIFNCTFVVQLTLPLSWATFYFTVIDFALANLIFQTRGPATVKDHDDYYGSKQSHKGVAPLHRYFNKVN